MGLGVTRTELDLSVYNLLKDAGRAAEDVLLKTEVPRTCCRNIDLSAAEVQWSPRSPASGDWPGRCAAQADYDSS